MLRPILRAAVEALEVGLPLDRIAIFIHNPADLERAGAVFAEEQARHGRFDVFVSYAHRDLAAQELVVNQLRQFYPGVRIFLDRLTLRPGVQWQQSIYQAMDRCRRIVALLTPAYIESPMCVEEFNIGLMRNRDTKQTILQPMLMQGTPLETYMRSVQHADCVEVDPVKTREALGALVAGLR